MSDCVFCDWEFSWTDPPRAVFRLDKLSPLRWSAQWGLLQGPIEVNPEYVVGVATAAHWAAEHPWQFKLALEADQGVSEWQWGSPVT